MSVDDCLRAAAMMHRFLDDELDEATADEIRAHLDACESCVGGYDVEVVLRSTIRRCCRETAPDELRARLVRIRIEGRG